MKTNNKMQVKIKLNSYVWSDTNKMREFLKANEGKWIDVETDHLFNNQYNTKEFRILDRNISAVRNDARFNKAKCKYCGEMINVGEEESHYIKQESKGCNGCFWFSSIGKTETTIREYEGQSYEDIKPVKSCTYDNGCKNDKCREYGFDYFTPGNTYFMKYPNGYTKPIEEMKDIKIGTYTLSSHPTLSYYRLSNGRKRFDFIYEDNKFYVLGIGWKQCSKLDIPDKANKELVKIMQQITSI